MRATEQEYDTVPGRSRLDFGMLVAAKTAVLLRASSTSATSSRVLGRIRSAPRDLLGY